MVAVVIQWFSHAFMILYVISWFLFALGQHVWIHLTCITYSFALFLIVYIRLELLGSFWKLLCTNCKWWGPPGKRPPRTVTTNTLLHYPWPFRLKESGNHACKSKALEPQTVMAMKAMRRKAMKAAKKDDDDAAAPMKRRRAMKAKKWAQIQPAIPDFGQFKHFQTLSSHSRSRGKTQTINKYIVRSWWDIDLKPSDHGPSQVICNS